MGYVYLFDNFSLKILKLMILEEEREIENLVLALYELCNLDI